MKDALKKLMGGSLSPASPLSRLAGPAHRESTEIPVDDKKSTRDSEYRRVYLERKKKAGGEKKD